LVRLRPGAYLAPTEYVARNRFDADRHASVLAAIGAAMANPCAVVSHATAAVLEGIALWNMPRMPCLTVLPHFVGDIESVHLHRAQMPDSHRTIAHGTQCTSVARTVIDIGREEGAVSALVAADAALHAGLVDHRTLRDQLSDCRGWPGVRAARTAIEFADERSESPLESASRFLLDGRVPAPEPQASIYDEHGRFCGRVDLLWDELGVVGEADGMRKYDDDEQVSLRDEKVRQGLLEDTGLRVVRWTRSDLDDPERLAGRIKAEFDKAKRAASMRRWAVVRLPRAA
jgi:hypothetical protein